MKIIEIGELVSLVDDEDENSFENDYNELSDFQCDNDYAHYFEDMY